jgi:hypothetical protein
MSTQINGRMIRWRLFKAHLVDACEGCQPTHRNGRKEEFEVENDFVFVVRPSTFVGLSDPLWKETIFEVVGSANDQDNRSDSHLSGSSLTT